MIPVRRCILCGDAGLKFAPATVAPFVVERCGIAAPVPAIRSAWHGTLVDGYPVHPYSDIDPLAPDIILVASPMWEKEICAGLGE